MIDTSQHFRGVALVLGSALAFSAAGVLTKAIAADTWTIVCWRGLVGGLIVAGYVGWRWRQRPMGGIRRLGMQGWVLAAVGAIASLVFILSFKMTYVGNVVAIYATAPFLAAGLSWLLLNETPRMRTLLAAVVSLGGVAVIVHQSLALGNVAGDLVALAMAALNALYMVLIRRFRETDAVLAGALSALLLVPVGFAFGSPLDVVPSDVPLLGLFGVAWAVALVLWTEGTKLIPAAESGFIGTAETPFAIVLAWIVLSELPPSASLVGGAVVIAAVAAHAGWDVRGRKCQRVARR